MRVLSIFNHRIHGVSRRKEMIFVPKPPCYSVTSVVFILLGSKELLIVVMSLTLRNFNSFIVNNPVNKAVFLINTARPPAG